MKRVIIIAFLLGGCSTWSGDFDCGIGQGMKCASLSKVNKAMDRGEIDLDDDCVPCEDASSENQCVKARKTIAPTPVHIWIAPQADSFPPITTLAESKG